MLEPVRPGHAPHRRATCRWVALVRDRPLDLAELVEAGLELELRGPHIRRFQSVRSGHSPSNGAPSPLSTAVASCLGRRRSMTAGAPLATMHIKRIRVTIPRAMKRAMKFASLIGQINRDGGRQLAKYPEFLGAPGRIRTCAPASGGRSINRSGAAIDPYGHIQALRRPRILSDAHRFIAQSIARVAVATGLFCAQHFGLRCGRLVQAAGRAKVTMSSAPRSAAMRARTGVVGMAPPPRVANWRRWRVGRVR